MDNNKILYRMIAIYAIVCMLVILLVSSAIYSVVSREIRDVIYQFQVQNLKQISNTVSFRAEYANYLMLQAKINQKTSKLFYSSEQDVVMDAVKSMDELRSAVRRFILSTFTMNMTDRFIIPGKIWCLQSVPWKTSRIRILLKCFKM